MTAAMTSSIIDFCRKLSEEMCCDYYALYDYVEQKTLQTKNLYQSCTKAKQAAELGLMNGRGYIYIDATDNVDYKRWIDALTILGYNQTIQKRNKARFSFAGQEIFLSRGYYGKRKTKKETLYRESSCYS